MNEETLKRKSPEEIDDMKREFLDKSQEVGSAEIALQESLFEVMVEDEEKDRGVKMDEAERNKFLEEEYIESSLNGIFSRFILSDDGYGMLIEYMNTKDSEKHNEIGRKLFSILKANKSAK